MSLTYAFPTASDYRLLQLTDCHMLADPAADYQGIQPYQHVLRLLQQLQSQRFDAVILTGDLTQDESLASYQHLADLFAAWSCPVFYVAGNHDDEDLMQQAFAKPPFHPAKALQSPHWRWLLLNTKGPTPAGRLGPTRLIELSRQLREPELAANLPVWLFCHHHPLPVGGAIDAVGLEDATDLFAVLASHPQVQGLSHGHCHLAYQSEGPRGLRLVGCPATSVQFLRQKEWQTVDEGPQGCIWHFTAKGQVQWEFVQCCMEN